jgi:2-polyprenyl-3-methyl-5-hydroxy-6-metoxy-1,4-benzoquinol methylase
MKNFLFQIGGEKSASYDGILMRANPSLHAETLMQAKDYFPKNAKIVDLGAGQGAFSKRLHDNGYDVLSVDMDPSDFKAAPIPFKAVNFNDEAELKQFRQQYKETFDVAIGMEVIEHVENPWEYIRLLSDLVKPGGTILITTPNIESSFSKLMFLFTGKHLHFNQSDLEGSGHINPLNMFELETIISKTNLKIVKKAVLCRISKMILSSNIKINFISVLNLFFGWSFGAMRSGDIAMIIAKK